MTVYNPILPDPRITMQVRQGKYQTVTFQLGIPGSPPDLTGYTAQLNVRAQWPYGTGSPAALIVKTTSAGITALDDDGKITINYIPGDTQAITLAALPNYRGIFEIEVYDGSGHPVDTYSFRGVFQLEPEGVLE